MKRKSTKEEINYARKLRKEENEHPLPLPSVDFGKLKPLKRKKNDIRRSH